MNKDFRYQSLICKCGHIRGHHYRKNYLIVGFLRRHGKYGNIDYTGCDGCNWWNKTCKQFIPVRISDDFWNFERDWRYEIKDDELLKIYNDEIWGHEKGIVLMTAYQWLCKNEERYVEMLKKHGVEIDDFVSEFGVKGEK